MKSEDNTSNRKVSERLSKIHPILISIPTKGLERDVYFAYLSKSKRWRSIVMNWVMDLLPEFTLSEVGPIYYSRQSLRNSLAHGSGKLKILTLPFLDIMFRQGVFFFDEQDGNYHYYNFAYPIVFEDQQFYAILVAREDRNGKRFYDNEFTRILKKDELSYDTGSTKKADNLTHPSTSRLLHDILNVNN